MCGKKTPEVKETLEQRELARIGAERWMQYKEMYLPVEQQYFDHVDSMNSTDKIKQAEGVAAINVESAFGDAVQQDVVELTSQGVDPTSGKFQTAISDNTQRHAEARAENVNKTGQAMQDAHIAGKQNIVAMGNNQAGEAVAGFGDVAAQSAVDARSKATSQYYENQGNEAAIGMAAGAAGAAYKNTQQQARP